MSSANRATPPAAVPGSWFQDPVARNYLFVGLASLMIVAAVLFFRHGHPLASLPALIAVAGLLLRSPVIPGLFLILVSAVTAPLATWTRFNIDSDVPFNHFRLMDLVLVGSLLTYLACQFRLLSLTLQGMPPDAPTGQQLKGEKPPRRPSSIAPPEEMGRMFAVIGVCVIFGQMAWLLVSEMRLELRSFPPLRLREFHGQPMANWWYPESEWVTRFLILSGLLAVVTIPAALVFWYWRLAWLGPAEARMVLLDTGWRESRRECNRQEKWRAWGLTRWQRKRERLPKPIPEERPKPRGPRRGFGEALAVTCGMVFVGGFVAFVAVFILVKMLGR